MGRKLICYNTIITMKSTEHFKEIILGYLENKAAIEELETKLKSNTHA